MNLIPPPIPFPRSHGERCTEAFHQSAFADALRGTVAGPEERRQMAATLERLRAREGGEEAEASGEGSEEGEEGGDGAVLPPSVIDRLSRDLDDQVGGDCCGVPGPFPPRR